MKKMAALGAGFLVVFSIVIHAVLFRSREISTEKMGVVIVELKRFDDVEVIRGQRQVKYYKNGQAIFIHRNQSGPGLVATVTDGASREIEPEEIKLWTRLLE